MWYKNRFKKIISLLAIISIAMCLTACSSGSDEGAGFEVVWDGIYSYSDYGMTYNSAGNARLCDAATGEDVVICSQPDCRHGRNKDCDGYIGAMSTDLFLSDKYELFIKKPAMEGNMSKGYNDVELWRADLDGRNRKLLASLENTQLTISADYADGLFVYCYREQNEDKVSANGVTFDSLEKCRAGVYVIDVETGDARLIDSIEGYNATMAAAIIQDNKVYYTICEEDAVRDFELGPDVDWDKEAAFREAHFFMSLYCYNLESGEKTQIWGKSNRSIVIHGTGYIIYPADGESIYRIVADGQITEVENPEFIRTINSDKITGEYIYGNRIYLVCNEEIFAFDLKENKLESLTDGPIDNSGLICIEAITGKKVFYMALVQGEYCRYAVDKTSFMKGDLSEAVKLE